MNQKNPDHKDIKKWQNSLRALVTDSNKFCGKHLQKSNVKMHVNIME